MNNSLLEFCGELEAAIRVAYEGATTIGDAEKLASGFLSASLQIGAEMEAADLDRRMKKSGVKAVRAAVYLAEASKGDKKPSDKLLEAIVDSSNEVRVAQDDYDTAEVYVNRLNNYLGVFHEAHVYFRTIAKGAFNG